MNKDYLEEIEEILKKNNAGSAVICISEETGKNNEQITSYVFGCSVIHGVGILETAKDGIFRSNMHPKRGEK